ncbi:MAG: GNAT family N-acetyltransferase [Candidatus Heimdallarchaeota archaeon]|nr:MAG: GNAT family N-acetyltransferase [Candidatus Heimdallarchaeota archaeon]
MTPTKELNTDLSFRPLKVDDIDTIIEIDEKILRRKRSDLFRNQLMEQITKHGDESFGAVTSKGKLVGYLIAETVVYIYGTDDLSAWIILLGVDPEYQDQGVGTALVKQALDYFNQKGIKTIRTICAWNWGDLVEFFSSVGFDLSTYLTLELNIGS